VETTNLAAAVTVNCIMGWNVRKTNNTDSHYSHSGQIFSCGRKTLNKSKTGNPHSQRYVIFEQVTRLTFCLFY